MPKEQIPEEDFCKLNIGTNNEHKLEGSKFGLKIKTLRGVKHLENVSIAAERGEVKSNFFICEYFFLFWCSGYTKNLGVIIKHIFIDGLQNYNMIDNYRNVSNFQL